MAKFLISGVVGGIGNALFKRLIEAGHEIYAIGHDGEGMQKLQNQYSNFKHYVVCDYTNPQDIEKSCKDLWQYGPFDGFCYCSGQTQVQSVRKMKYEENLKLFNINFFAFLEVLRLFVRHKPRNCVSRVVVLSSIASVLPSYYTSLYGASKAAIDAFLKTASLELINFKISINSLQPAYVDTKMGRILEVLGDFDERIAKSQPMGIISTEDVAIELEYMLTKMPLTVTGSCRLISACCH